MGGRAVVCGAVRAFAVGALVAVVVAVSAPPAASVRAGFAAAVQTHAGVDELARAAGAPVRLLQAPPADAMSAVVSTPILVIGSYQQVLINGDRAGAGLGALTWSACLQAVAISNARRMAAQGYISHTNGAWLDLDCHLGVQGGENVGWWSGGVDDAQLNSMFMASPDHRANIMGPYHYVATAWAVAANGFAYVAVEFN